MYMLKGQTDEALKHYRTAIEIRPDFEQSYVNLGTGLMVRGEFAEAEANFRTALEKNPGYVEAYCEVGRLFCAGRRSSRRESPRSARPSKSPPTTTRPGRHWRPNSGQPGTSRRGHSVLRNSPAATGHRQRSDRKLGYLYYVKRQPRKALEYWTSFLDNNPDSLPVLTMTAWLLATDPDAAVRNGGKALALAQRAAKISQGRDSPVLVALAAATAESGDFLRAAEIVEQANRLPDRPFSEAGMLELQRKYQAGNRYYDGLASLRMTLGAARGKATSAE